MFQRAKREILMYFVIAFLWAWACWIPVVFLRKGDSFGNLLTLLGTFGTLVSSLALSIYAGGKRGAIGLLRRATRLKMSLIVFCWSVVLPLVIALASWRLAGGTQVNNDAITIATRFVLYLFLGGSVAEEFGWRGYAWPRLRERFRLPQASIALGGVVGCVASAAFLYSWHHAGVDSILGVRGDLLRDVGDHGLVLRTARKYCSRPVISYDMEPLNCHLPAFRATRG